MSPGMCTRCEHPKRDHASWKGRCQRFTDGLDDPFVPGAKWTMCPCREYEDAVLPAPGEPLVFGAHKQRDVDAETAPAWPSLPVVGNRLAASLNRRLRR